MDDFHENCLIYKYTPIKLNKVRRIIAIGDIHGDMKVALKLLKIAKVIKINDGNIEWIGSDTHVVQTGDQLDSCRQGSNLCYKPGKKGDANKSDIHVLTLFTELDIKAQEHGGRVISLLGNHEINNVINRMGSVSQDDVEYFGNIDERVRQFQPGNKFSQLLGCTRLLFVMIGSNFFCHGGLIKPFIDKIRKTHEDPLDTLDRLNYVFRKWLITGNKDDEYAINLTAASGLSVEDACDYKLSILWNRILGNIKPDMANDSGHCNTTFLPIMDMIKMRNMIIGHTPQIFLGNDSINGTCDKRLWRIDNALSDAFDELKDTIKTNKSKKKFQVLEIINDVLFNIITENDTLATE